MESISKLLTDERGQTRRRVIRKAAYSAPVVFAIAAAPKVALGSSGGNPSGGNPSGGNPGGGNPGGGNPGGGSKPKTN